MKKVYKEYSNGEITVEWRSELCNHSGVCINGLPTVFDVMERPWINVKGATTEEIQKVVDACPTRALAWRFNDKPKEEVLQNKTAGEVQVVLVPNGPIVIKGNMKLKMDNGAFEQRNGIVSLCRCKLSKKMPYCDGAHFKGKEERQCE
jgi:uncharacterized Fe-S cluster protein YjdI